jgi:hypothetical protein
VLPTRTRHRSKSLSMLQLALSPQLAGFVNHAQIDAVIGG